jgi:hypothetical protein
MWENPHREKSDREQSESFARGRVQAGPTFRQFVLASFCQPMRIPTTRF